MAEYLKRFREPAAWAVLGVVVAFMLLSIVRLVTAVTSGRLPVFSAFQDIANSSMNLTLVLLLVTLVCFCLFVVPASPRAVKVARASAWVVTIGTVLTIVATAFGLSASTGVLGVLLELLGGLLDIFLKTLAAVVLWIIFRAVHAGRLRPNLSTPEAESTAAPATLDQEPLSWWKPDEASGSVWRTAAEAAQGSVPDNYAPTEQRSTWVAKPRSGAADAARWRHLDQQQPVRLTNPDDVERDTP